jgi:hypothetical protein
MKAGKGFCTWRSCLSVAVVGALALAVSVQGAPRAGERDKSGKSGTSRLVTGPAAQLNDAIAAGATATITLQPVNPPGAPAPAAYPGGSSISGQTLTLGSVPARAWIEIQYTGWAPETLKTIQVTIDATDVQMNGGGYSGSAADCAGGPGGGNLTPAREACPSTNAAGHAVCNNLAGPACSPPASRCVSWDGVNPSYFIAGLWCQPGFQDTCKPNWGALGLNATFAVDISSLNYRYGFTADVGEEPTDFAPSYAGSLVLDVPANAKGIYEIDIDSIQSFMQNPNPPGTNDIPIASLNSAFIEVECGRCCREQGTICVPSLTFGECQALGGIFGANELCPVDGGPDCPTCTQNSDCNDGDGCTQDICNVATGACSNPPNASWDQVNECCNAANGVETTLGCADQCEAASCSDGGNRGTAICTGTPGADCDDDNPCTYADTCAGGAGSCAGSDANLVACVDSSDCAAATGVGYPCIDGFCNCTLTPDLDIEIIDTGDDDNCFDAGEKVTACVRVAASSSPVNGGQVLIGYDNSCLDYNGTILADPYSFTVYGPVVNEGDGSIFVAVGVEFGAGDGPNGNADLVCFSFNKIGDCNSCQICPLNNNPQNTYLTDNEGQRITVQANCSKEIYAESSLELSTPPANIKTNVDCDRPTAIESWDAPSATDECGDAQVFCRGEHESGLIYDSATVNGGGELPIGASSFCCYAVSDGPCGTTVGCPPDTSCGDSDSDGKPDGCWTVTVNDETSLDITVGLSPSSQSKPGDNLTRCIKFTLYSNCIQEPLVFSDDVSFGGLFEFVGKSTGKIKIPGSGQWDCITAQDQLHTLRSCYTFASNGSDCVNGQLSAQFSGDPRLGGNWLIGGNLDGWKKDDPNASPSLDVIDILDFGTFASQYPGDYGFTDTPCGTPGPNADINGDGVVDMDDYSFVSMNFLTSAKECCCGPQGASATAITEISVAQLRAMGLADLISADLNGDGMLNLADMAAFDQGVRPATKAPAKGGSRTGSR